MMELGILVLKMGVIMYSEVILCNDDSKEIMTVVGDHETIPNFKYCYDKDNNKIKVSLANLGSLIIKGHDNQEVRIKKSALEESNLLYCNGHRAVWFSREGFVGLPKILANEVLVSGF